MSELEQRNEELLGTIQVLEELIEDAISELEAYDTLKGNQSGVVNG